MSRASDNRTLERHGFMQGAASDSDKESHTCHTCGFRVSGGRVWWHHLTTHCRSCALFLAWMDENGTKKGEQ
jgi:hypothetical protein